MRRTLSTGLAILIVTTATLDAAEYFVSPTGSAQNDGSRISPFQTLNHAAQRMRPGDTCWLRKGRYRAETVFDGLKGLRDKPLMFRAIPGERVVMDGTIRLPARWSLWKNGIYKLKVTTPVWQLFTGSKLVHVARWPNASFRDGSIWRMQECMRFADREFVRGKPTGKTTDGLIHDRNAHSDEENSDGQGAVKLSTGEGVNLTTLAETGVDFTDAIAVLNLGHWLTWARPVTDHQAGRNWFRYDSRGTEMAKYVAYYMLGLPALDRPNEWWYDAKSQTVYFRPPGDHDPNELNMFGKVRDYSLQLSGCSDLVFQGMEFFGSTFSMIDCDHVVIEDGVLTYPSTNKFMLGDFSWFNAADKATGGNVMTQIVNQTSKPHGNVVRNCEIAFANSPAIALESSGSIVEDCYIHDIEWDVNSSGGSGSLPGGEGSIIRHNTIHSAGNSEGIRPGAGSIVEYNRLWHMGNLQHDGSAINIGTGAQRGTVVRFNWVHDTNRQGIRFDSTRTTMGSSGCLHHNVVFHLGGRDSKFKGDYHLLFNNTFHDSCFAIPNQYGDTPEHNRNTLVRNNLADCMVAWTARRPDEPINARLENNMIGKGVVQQNLRDPVNLDFRPKSGAPLVDAGQAIADKDRPSDEIRCASPSFVGKAPDIGAYEFGDKRYWIPGRRNAKVSTPIPPDGALNVKKDTDLMFLEARGAHRHFVTFSNAARDHSGQLELAGSNIAEPNELRAGQTYSWRVDAVMPGGVIVKGDLWTFTVEE